MNKLFFILLLLVANFTFSQTKVIDSLIKAYAVCDTDSSRVDNLIATAKAFNDINPRKSIDYGISALKLAQSINNYQKEVLAFKAIGDGNDLIGNVSEAISNYKEAYTIASNINDLQSMANLKLDLGDHYTDIGNEALSLEYFESAELIFTQINDYKGLCRADLYLVDALSRGVFDSTRTFYYLERARRISIGHNNYVSDYIYANLATYFYKKKDYKAAIDNATKSIQYAEKQNNLNVLAEQYLLLANIYVTLNDIPNAVFNVKKGTEMANQSNISDNILQSYFIQSQVLTKEKKFEDAIKFKTLYIIKKDSVQTNISKRIVRTYSEDKAKEVLKEQEIKRDAELKKSYLTSTIIFLVLILVLCIYGFSLYARNKLLKINLKLESAYNEINSKQAAILVQNETLTSQNEQIKIQANKIEELNKIKDRFLAIISHDLRSPLNSLKGLLSLLVAGKIPQENFQSLLPHLKNSLNTSLSLLDNILQWATSQSSGETFNFTTFDISKLALNQIFLFESESTSKGVKIINEIPLNTFVYADKNMIDLVVRNFVGNAIKFSHPKGEIVLSAKKIDDQIEVSVSDSGTGISQNDTAKLFQNKERFTTLGTNKEIGSGLGLSLCREFIEKNKGEIGVESKLNEGARFWFRLAKGEI